MSEELTDEQARAFIDNEAEALAKRNFKNHPESIAERKSEKTMDAADWTPRDALISMLRRIDNGEKVDELIICFAEIRGTKRHLAVTSYLAATSNPLVSYGLLTRALYKIQSPG